MTYTELSKYADVLIWGLKKSRKESFTKGDIVLILFHNKATALAEVLYQKLIKMNLNPIVRLVGNIEIEKTLYTFGSKQQIQFISPGEKALYQSLNGLISLRAPDSITHLQEIDSSRIALSALAYKPYREIINEREEKGKFGWTLCIMPTADMAKHAELTFIEYTNQIKKACFLNENNPVAKWEEIFNIALEIKTKLNELDVKYFHMETKKMDIRITPGEQRKWVGISGHNIPSFEIFLSPDWRGTEGIYYANQPSFRNGNRVSGVTLEFKSGQVFNATATEGEEFLKAQLEMDEGAARLGEYSLTDRRFSNIDKFMANTLYDENFGGNYGNSHVAVGNSYSNTFSGNPESLTKKKKKELGFNDSALHWDLVNTEPKRVTAYLKDGRKTLIYENGEFKL